MQLEAWQSHRELREALQKIGADPELADAHQAMLVNEHHLIKLIGFAKRLHGWSYVFVEHDSFGTPGHRREATIEYIKGYVVLNDVTPENVAKVADEAFSNPSAFLPKVEQDTVTQETAVSTASNAQTIRRLVKIHQERAVVAQAMQMLVARRMDEIRGRVSFMTQQTKHMRRVLAMMETYAGVYEEIVQIRDGVPAKESAPLHIIQTTRYMDEEVGDIHVNRFGQVGIDFSNIEAFDRWIAEPANLGIIAPWERCIIGFQPTRQNRRYSENPIVQIRLQALNETLYLLIKNGDRLYRICSEKLSAKPTLIPTLSEWGEIVSKVRNGEDYGARSEKADWVQRVMLLQGLLHRTDILNPMPHDDIDLFKEKDYEQGHVVLVRDYEAPAIDNGRESFDDWISRINSSATRGSRVYVSASVRDEDAASRNTRDKSGWLCRNPKPGVYEVERIIPATDSRHERLVILFDPDYETFDAETCTYRKKRGRDGYMLYRSEYNPSLWINYDALALDDVRYHVGNRAERRGYLRSLPLLTKLLAELIDEQKEEDEFASHICRVEGLDEAAVRRAITWWKTKNIWKRPLRADIDKAWRMIRRHAQGKE